MRAAAIALASVPLWLSFALRVLAQVPSFPVEFVVTDKTTGTALPCRIHLRDQARRPQRADRLPFWRDHFVCPGTARLDLAPGEYTYEIERGPEYALAAGTLKVKDDGPARVPVALERLIDLPAEGWWPGELHVHRPIDDMKLLMRAEDLYVAPVISWWHGRQGLRSHWSGGKLPPGNPLVEFDRNRYCHVLAGEDEREGGALLYFNLPAPLDLAGATLEYPSHLKFAAQARRDKNSWIDIEKPFWRDVPVWLSGQVDSIGLANNHMNRSQMYESEAWGKPRDTTRLPAPLGNGYWTQEIYYHILNSGLRLPPSAGSASGVLPNPVGYNRVYVHVDGPLSYDEWWKGLRAGRSFVTNGPLLRVRANERLPGHVFDGRAGEGITIDLRADLTTRDPIRALEIVKNGQVERAVPYDQWRKTGSLGSLRFDESGWFLVRAIADNPKTFRFASTAPYYVEIGERKRRISKRSAQFFLDWAIERAGQVKLDDAGQRAEVLQYHTAAKRFWEDTLASANAE
jgi:hypothetical protein